MVSNSEIMIPVIILFNVKINEIVERSKSNKNTSNYVKLCVSFIN